MFAGDKMIAAEGVRETDSPVWRFRSATVWRSADFERSCSHTGTVEQRMLVYFP